MRVFLYLFFFILVGCSTTYKGKDIFGADEFVLDSYKIQYTFRFEEKTRDILKPIQPIYTITFPLFNEDFSQNLLNCIKPTLDQLF